MQSPVVVDHIRYCLLDCSRNPDYTLAGYWKGTLQELGFVENSKDRSIDCMVDRIGSRWTVDQCGCSQPNNLKSKLFSINPFE